MATQSSVPAWRIPGTGEPGGLPSMGSHRVGHDWSDLAAAVEGYLAAQVKYRLRCRSVLCSVLLLLTEEASWWMQSLNITKYTFMRQREIENVLYCWHTQLGWPRLMVKPEESLRPDIKHGTPDRELDLGRGPVLFPECLNCLMVFLLASHLIKRFLLHKFPVI